MTLISQTEMYKSRPKDSFNLWLAWISGKVQGVRQASGYSIEHTADLVGVTQEYVRRIESGKQSPSGLFLEAFGACTGLRDSDFFMPDRYKSENIPKKPVDSAIED